MAWSRYDNPTADWHDPLTVRTNGKVELVHSHHEFQRVEREFGRGALQAVQEAIMEREDSHLASGGYSQAYVYNFSEQRDMEPVEIIEHMAGLVAEEGITCKLEVPPPSHHYPDRNSELTEIYIRF